MSVANCSDSKIKSCDRYYGCEATAATQQKCSAPGWRSVFTPYRSSQIASASRTCIGHDAMKLIAAADHSLCESFSLLKVESKSVVTTSLRLTRLLSQVNSAFYPTRDGKMGSVPP